MMKRFINNTIDTRVTDWEVHVSLNILVSSSHIKDLTLCFQLLHEKLISSFVFAKNNKCPHVEILCGPINDFQVIPHDSRIKVTLCETTLDMLRHFTLCFYKDGAAAVDHIDIETPDGGDITIQFTETGPPASEQEIRRRLSI